MMKATDFSNRDDLAEFRPLNWSAVGCVLVERQVSAGPMIVGEVRGQDASQMPLGENDDMARHSRRTEPMNRSAKGFCQGLRGAVTTSPIPMPLTR